MLYPGHNDIKLEILELINLDYVHLMPKGQEFYLESMKLDYDATVSLTQSEEHRDNLKLEFKLSRRLVRSVIEIIGPPGLLVMVSWVSYLLVTFQ